MPGQEADRFSLRTCLRKHAAVIALGLCSAGLTLTNLQHSLLWQDEAQTALISRTVLQHGVPLGTDGRNFFSQEVGAEYGPGYVWRWHTWLPFYVLAAFFGALGESTFIARLPFALCGVGCVIATYRLALALWNDARAAAAAGVLLAMSVPFLILARQCRYYSMTALFTVLVLLAYWRLMEGRRRATIALVAGLLLLFHTHYVYVAALVPALAVHAATWHRGRLRALAKALLATGVLCLPWVLWLSGMEYARQYGTTMFRPAVAWANLESFVTQLAAHSLPLLLLEVPVLALVVHAVRGTFRGCFGRELWCGLSLLWLVAAANLLLLAPVVPGTFFRYMAPLLPLVAVLSARIVAAVMRWHWTLGVLLVGLLLWREPLAEYAGELTHRFNGPVEGITSYLNANAGHRDVVAITYSDLPVAFYTRLRVVGGLTGEDPAAAGGANWIIIRRHACSPDEWPLRRFLEAELRRGKYTKIVLDSPDTKWQNREDPALHLFRSAENEERVVLWRKAQGD